MTLAEPMYLWLSCLLLVPLLLRPRRAWQFSALQLFAETRRWSFPAVLIMGVSGAACLSLLLALARPQLVTSQVIRQREARDIVLVIDLSLSMEGYMPQEEGQPSQRKLDLIRAAALTFVQRHKHDRIGLIVFGDDAFGVWPLSNDHTMLHKRLQRLETILPTQLRGTHFQRALLRSIAHFQELGQAQTKILLMLTDGLDTIDARAAERIVTRLKKARIKLYVLGMQLKQDTPIVRLTRRAQGHYYNIDRGAELVKALHDVDAQEPSRITVGLAGERKDLYPAFVAAGLVFLLLAMGLKSLWMVEV